MSALVLCFALIRLANVSTYQSFSSKQCKRQHAALADLNLTVVMQNALPDVLCVVQVALEGAVSKKAALNSLAQGNLPQACFVCLLEAC